MNEDHVASQKNQKDVRRTRSRARAPTLQNLELVLSTLVSDRLVYVRKDDRSCDLFELVRS